VWGSDLRGVCSAYQTDPKQAESVVSSVIRYLEAMRPSSARTSETTPLEPLFSDDMIEECDDLYEGGGGTERAPFAD
jgi:hypothetical protein